MGKNKISCVCSRCKKIHEVEYREAITEITKVAIETGRVFFGFHCEECDQILSEFNEEYMKNKILN